MKEKDSFSHVESPIRPIPTHERVRHSFKLSEQGAYWCTWCGLNEFQLKAKGYPTCVNFKRTIN